MNERRVLKRQVRALYSIVDAVNAHVNQQEALDALLEGIVRDLDYRAATLRLLDEEQQTLELKAAYGLSEEYLSKGAVELRRSGMDRRAVAGERFVISDVRSDPNFQYPQAAEQEGLVSTLVVPLRARDRIFGVLHVYTDRPYRFSEEEQALVAAAAYLSGQSILRSRLYEAFQTLAGQVNSHLELPNVLATLLLRLIRELNVKAGSIRLLGPQKRELHLAAAYGLSQDYMQKGEVRVDQSPIDQLALQGEVQFIDDITHSQLFQYPQEALREGIRSVLVLPLRVRGSAIGVMRIYSGQVRHFAAEELSFASTAADLGAMAIENAKLHEALKARLEALKADNDGWYRFLALS